VMPTAKAGVRGAAGGTSETVETDRCFAAPPQPASTSRAAAAATAPPRLRRR
jgi:hypothetical protein